MARRLSCPHCGWTGRSPGTHGRAFRYLEDVTSLRWVEGLDAAGVLRVDAAEQISTEDDGRSPATAVRRVPGRVSSAEWSQSGVHLLSAHRAK